MSKTTPQFDFEKALEELKEGRNLSGKNGILTSLIKQLTEAALAAELEQHILSGDEQNRKNGSTPKTVRSTSGSFQLETPRDRNGTFEPQLVKKHQTHLTDEIERKILSLQTTYGGDLNWPSSDTELLTLPKYELSQVKGSVLV